MKLKLAFGLITLLLTQLNAQMLPKTSNQAKWQQKVDYQISVSLNTQNHTLNAFETIFYTNNSPNTLQEIFIHLWPNAYKNRNTAFAKQELEKGDLKFYFSQESEKGYIDSLNFTSKGKALKWNYTSDIDIAIVKLNEPLRPGESIEISTPFFVKLPKVFSRLGHEDSIYCITQWYPKPAVYDVNGWNPMPYLNQGEFYSEFGKFDVSISVPKNFLVAATGLVQAEEEKNWWLERSKNPKAEHPSANKTKTVRFIQDSVHDFAWFGSEKFTSANSSVTLNNGKIVETWLFGKPEKKNKAPEGIEFINEGVKFYSDKVGNYPYSIAQVVITPLVAGAGMEYPTITNCGSNDKTTIVHELGHNWFYGIIASNEREYPWMDESINTYYEERNKRENAAKKKQVERTGFLARLSNIDQSNFLYKYSARKNMDQAGNLHSNEYTDNNYGAIIYAKNPIALQYLESYLGTEKFDRMMQEYFEKWKFKHPLPKDFIDHVNQYSNEDLSWFFNDVLGSSKKFDYKISSVSKDKIKIKNKGSINGPFSISILSDDSLLKTTWVKGFEGKQTYNINALQFSQYQNAPNVKFQLHYGYKSFDLYHQNNEMPAKGLCKTCKQIKFQPLFSMEQEQTRQVFWAPVYAFNYSNRSMLGVAFYNSMIPQKKSEFVFLPLYSFETKDLNGYAQYWRNFYTQGKLKSIQVGLKSSRFATRGTFYNSGDPILHAFIEDSAYANYYGNMSYEKLAPFIRFNLKPKKARSGIEQAFELRYVMINEQAADRAFSYMFLRDYYGIATAGYEYKNPAVLYPSQLRVNFQKGVQFATMNKLSLEFIQQFKVSKHKSMASLRFFAGTFLFTKTRESSLKTDLFGQRAYFQAGGRTGINDYLYDEAMVGRPLMSTDNGISGMSRVFANQVLLGEAGFRNFANVGSTNTFLSALNLSYPAPIPFPIGVYTDILYWQQPAGEITISGVAGISTITFPPKMQLTYSGGIYLDVIRDVATMYIPLFYSSDVLGYWDNNNFDTLFKRVSFSINLNKLNPIDLIRNIKL
ncbi:MAG: M1 family metallopeptidase [Bacteroidia bacterium]|nr:M1 family metallopeptidase [Bacteroidia bacterium]